MAQRHNSRSSGGRPRSGVRTSPRSGTVEIFTRPDQHWFWRIIGLLVRFRAELCATTVFVTVYLVARDQIGPDATTITMISVVVVVLIVPASRRFTIRRVWCVITRHRMRSCMVKTRTMTHHGRSPFLVWARPSPVGERLRVWLPAGLSVKDLERIAPELAAACWARETRITAVRAQAALVIVDIVRRDPLSSRTPLTPTLLNNIDHGPTGPAKTDNTDDDGTVVPLPARSTVTPPATTPATGSDPATNGRPERKTRTTTSRNGSTTPTAPNGTAAQNGPDPVTGYGGVDVSDYV